MYVYRKFRKFYLSLEIYFSFPVFFVFHILRFNFIARDFSWVRSMVQYSYGQHYALSLFDLRSGVVLGREARSRVYIVIKSHSRRAIFLPAAMLSAYFPRVTPSYWKTYF